MIFRRFLQITLSLSCYLSAASHAQTADRPQPEISTGVQQLKAAQGKEFMAVTANPHATKAAYDILNRGGGAVDAAIAAQLVLGLVEPQSSGLGGGGFALVYDAKEKRLRSYDARETAPNLAGPFLFFKNGKPLGFKDAMIGGRAVGVPGIPMLLSSIHERHGKLTWMELFDAAIKLADKGFVVSPRLSKMIAAEADDFRDDPIASAYFLPNDIPLKEGHLLTNHAYRDTLKDYQFFNARRFYRGEVARSIVYKVQNIQNNPGLLSLHDFQSYRVKERQPVCGPYRDHIVCSMGEPSSGALTLLQTLGMLEHFDISKESAKSWHVISQASALAFADRSLYMADPDFVNTPNISLINPEYLKARAALISRNKPLETVGAGIPPDWDGTLFNRGETLAQPGTTHISIIDKEGNIVSMTSSIEGAFGAHVMTDGFLLNNQLTDFSFDPLSKCKANEPITNQERTQPDINIDTGSFRVFIATDACPREDAFVANMVEPGKRPRSSMSPTIVFNARGEPLLILGSAGGSRIINHVLQRIIAVVDWGHSIEDAIAAPHILARDSMIEVEEGSDKEQLVYIGNKVAIKDINSGLTAIHIQDSLIKGAADPRREGQAQGK